MWVSVDLPPFDMAARTISKLQLISGEYKKGAPYSNVEEMITKGGTKFISIAKNAEVNAGIVADKNGLIIKQEFRHL